LKTVFRSYYKLNKYSNRIQGKAYSLVCFAPSVYILNLKI
jgi:hypothetical protein